MWLGGLGQIKKVWARLDEAGRDWDWLVEIWLVFNFNPEKVCVHIHQEGGLIQTPI